MSTRNQQHQYEHSRPKGINKKYQFYYIQTFLLICTQVQIVKVQIKPIKNRKLEHREKSSTVIDCLCEQCAYGTAEKYNTKCSPISSMYPREIDMESKYKCI